MSCFSLLLYVLSHVCVAFISVCIMNVHLSIKAHIRVDLDAHEWERCMPKPQVDFWCPLLVLTLFVEVRASHLNQEFIDKVGLHRDLVLHISSFPVTRITGKP